jgi:hypothetical protein
MLVQLMTLKGIKERHSEMLTLRDPMRFHSTEQSSARGQSLLRVLWVADGKGNITSGVRTININGFVAQQTFTCEYSVNPDGTGSAVCLLDNPLPGAPAVETFDFALERRARAFRLLGTTAGITVLGSGAKQQH